MSQGYFFRFLDSITYVVSNEDAADKSTVDLHVLSDMYIGFFIICSKLVSGSW